MLGSKSRLYWIFVGGVALATACSLNPQPLPPSSDDDRGGTSSSTSGGASVGDADGSQNAADGGDGGDGGVGEAGDASLDGGTD